MIAAPLRQRKRTITGLGAGYRRALGLSQNARYASDPVGWITDESILDEFLWSKQREIAESVSRERYTAVQSAHDTGKSFIMSRLAAWWIDTKPDPFVVTTAPTWKQVNAILWREMRKAHRRGELNGRINLDAEWYMGSDELVAFGRKPADYDQAAFQGIHALNVLVIIDEACGVPQSLFEAADSLATNERARVVAIGNPDDPSAYFEQVCRPGSGWNVIQISAFDTPAFTDEEVPEELLELLVSRTWVRERVKRWGRRSPTYISKVLGLFPEISDFTLFTPKMLREAQQNTIIPREPGMLGVDVARFGDDKTVIARNRNGRVRIVKTLEKVDTHDTSQVVANIMRPFHGHVPANIDVIGVGGGVYDNLRHWGYPVIEFNGSQTPSDTERFLNLRAEAYWTVREMFEDGLVDLPEFGEDEDLINELSSIEFQIKGKGKIAIETKEEWRQRTGLPSPDRADAVVMALAGVAPMVFADVTPSGEGSITGDLLHRKL